LRFFVRLASFSWDKHRAASLRCRVALACFSLGSDVEGTKRFSDPSSRYKKNDALHATPTGKNNFALSETNETRFLARMERENGLVFHHPRTFFSIAMMNGG